MNFGIKQENSKCFCKECGKELKFEIPEIFNFCPFCSAPLNLVAYNVSKEKEKSLKLNVVSEIVKMSNSKQTFLDVKNYLTKISNE